MTGVVVVLLVLLAASNGGNDVSKGVATLAGSGVTGYRAAVWWGTASTLAGALLSIPVAGAMSKLFTSGIVAGYPSGGFIVAVLAATAAWVAFATAARLPVSTTHALVGALVGASLRVSVQAVHWDALLTKVAVPLLLSVLVAYVLSAAISLVGALIRRLGHRPQDASGPPAAPDYAIGLRETASSGTLAERVTPRVSGRAARIAHWCSSGATCLARGLNDTPKLAAVGAVALLPAGLTVPSVTLIVAAAMTIGALVAGIRVTRRLGEGIVHMSYAEGLRANVVTATLVGLGAAAGMPMSTTQVSTGAITGSAGLQAGRINAGTVRDFALAWTITPVVSAVVAWTLAAVIACTRHT